MKSASQIISLVICFTFFSTVAFAQQNSDSIKGFAEDTIKINFLSLKDKPKFKKVHHDSTYVMKIENINLSLYKIDDTSGQQNFNTEMPDIFKGIKLPGYLNLALPPNPVKVAPDGAASPIKVLVENESERIKNELAIITKAVNKINETAQLNNDFKNLYSSCNTSFKIIDSTKRVIVDKFLEMADINDSLQANRLNNTLVDFIATAVNAKVALDRLLPAHLSTIKATIKGNMDNIITPWNNSPLPKTNPNYAAKFFVVKQATDENETLTAYKDSITAIVAKAGDAVTEMKKFRDENKINELVTNYKMINESNFTYYSDPQKIKGDVAKFKLKISAEKPLPCNTPTKVSISETYKTVGGWKVDFSTGLFFNTGNADFLGREIQYKPVNDSTVQIQTKDGGKRVLLSVGALMHIYCRSGKKVNYAFSPGLSTTTAFDGINFHLGGSVLFGMEDRLVITAGLVIREAKILDRNYEFDTNYAKKLLPEAPPTIKVFPKAGGFLSLTYNWSKVKK